MDKQERFIDSLSAVRRKKKLTQREIELAQKVISRVENHETDPRLSTVIKYLDAMGYDINDIFKEETIMKRPNKFMMDYLNLKLKDEGSSLRYVEKNKDSGLTVYELQVVDKYVDARVHSSISITRAFETMVREFFEKCGAEYTDTVLTIFVA